MSGVTEVDAKRVARFYELIYRVRQGETLTDDELDECRAIESEMHLQSLHDEFGAIMEKAGAMVDDGSYAALFRPGHPEWTDEERDIIRYVETLNMH